MLPNFFIAGVSRSGTTSLYYYLKQHPQISFPALKEPRYFSSYNLKLPQTGPGDQSVDKKLVTQFEEYEQLYADTNNVLVGDASSEYLYNYEQSIPEIKARIGDVPVILMLRNPIDRSYSAYSNLVRDGRETLPFEEALALEDQRIADGYDEMWHYTKVSTYAAGVKAFKTHFSKVKVLIFDEFSEDPERAVHEVLDFLEAEPMNNVNTSVSYSKSGKPKGKLVTLLFGRGNLLGNALRGLAFSLLGRTNVERVGRLLMSEQDDLGLELRRKLYTQFKDDITELEHILGKNLNAWKVD